VYMCKHGAINKYL